MTNFRSQEFLQIANSLFNCLEVSSSASDKAKLLAKNSNLDDSGISLPILPSRINLELDNISVTPKMVKVVITNLGCFPVEVLKN